MTILSRINSSLMNQVSHGTMNRVFDHTEKDAGRSDPVPWGYFGGPGRPAPEYKIKGNTLDIETR